MLATVMQVLDTTIANVALPHMQASLGASQDEINWVLTSYIVASAIAMPLTGWLADRLGRKTLLLVAVVGFTVASMLCGLAPSLAEMVLFRVLQGICGALLVPLAQSILLDINPREKIGQAMAIFGAGIMVGPIIGPMLGGWLTESFNWRWVFLVNLPVGVLAFSVLFADDAQEHHQAAAVRLLRLRHAGDRRGVDCSCCSTAASSRMVRLGGNLDLSGPGDLGAVDVRRPLLIGEEPVLRPRHVQGPQFRRPAWRSSS